jgi:hypothetical protein
MAHISNFKRFKILLENNNLNYIAINESYPASTSTPNAAGDKIGKSGDSYQGILNISPGGQDAFNNSGQAVARDAAQECFGKTTMPGFKVGTRSSFIDDNTETSNIYRALIGGAAMMAGKSKLLGDDDDIAKYASAFAAKTTKVGTKKLILKKDSTYRVISVEEVKTNLIKTGAGKKGYSALDSVMRYINAFNLRNWVLGSGVQYDPNKILNDNNRVDLTSNSNSTIDEKGFLYLVSPGEFVQSKGEREDVDQVVQGEEAKSGAVEVSFGNMKYAVDPTNPKVKEIGDKIKSYLGDQGTIKAITITSSASPSWNGAKTGLSNGTGAPGGGKLTKDNFASETSELGNQYLAYLRGERFEAALHAYLGDAYPANAKTTIAWKVSTDAPGSGKHIKYTVTTTGKAPQTITKTEFQGGDGEVKKGVAELVIYKVTFKNSAFAGESKGKKKDYFKLEEGDPIFIYGLKNKKKRFKTTVSKVEGNKVYYKKGDGSDEFLKQSRYAGLSSKPKDTGDDF